MRIKTLREEILEGDIIRRLTHTHPIMAKKSVFFLVRLNKEISFASPYFKWWYNLRRGKNRPKMELHTRMIIINFRNLENIEKELHGFVESELRAPIASYLLDQSMAESDSGKLSESDVRDGRSYPIGPARIQIIEDELK